MNLMMILTYDYINISIYNYQSSIYIFFSLAAREDHPELNL